MAISRRGGSKLVDQCGSRLDQVGTHPGGCVGTFSRVWNGLRRRHRVPKWLKMAKNAPFVAISRPGSSKLVDHCGSRLDQVRAHPGRCVGTFSQVRNGHRGRQRVPKWLKKAVNGPFVAISRPGGSKLVDLRGSRLDQVRAHPGRCVGTLSRVRNGHWGAP